MQVCPNCHERGIPSLFKLTAVPGIKQSCLHCSSHWEACWRAWISWAVLVGPGLFGGYLSLYADLDAAGSEMVTTIAKWLVAVGLLAGLLLYVVLQIYWVRAVSPTDRISK